MTKNMNVLARIGLLMGGIFWTVAFAVPSAYAQVANPIFEEIVQKGAPIAGGFRKIRPPTLADAMNSNVQQQTIASLLLKKPGAPLAFKDFVADNIRAPHIMIIDDLEYSGAGISSHSIDLWFVVHGNLKQMSDPKFLQGQFKQNNKNQIHVLTAAEKKSRNIEVANAPGISEYYAHDEFTIFPNNAVIQIRATAHATETVNDNSVVLAAILDPRFDNDAKFPNQWLPVLRPEAGGGGVGPLALGNPTVYNDAAGYIKITTLLPPAPNNLQLVEYHLVYNEPQAWFQGKNLLRSKLPQQAPDDVREFRRKVKEALEHPDADAEAPKAE